MTSGETTSANHSDTGNDIYLPSKYHFLLKLFNCVSIFADLHYEESFDALKSFGWFNEGKFVREVLEVLSAMGFTPREKTEPLKNKKLYFKKLSPKMMSMVSALFYKFEPLIKSKILALLDEKNFINLEVVDQISVLCLALLHCAMKYRGDGKILHNPQVI